MKNFEDCENQLIDPLIYGIMFYKSNSEIIDKNKSTEVIGEDFYNDLLEIKDEIKLDRHFLDILTDVLLLIKFLLSIIFFLNFFNNDMFRFLIKKNVQGKNEVTRNLCSSVIEKFNGYEMIRQDLAHKEKSLIQLLLT